MHFKHEIRCQKTIFQILTIILLIDMDLFFYVLFIALVGKIITIKSVA